MICPDALIKRLMLLHFIPAMTGFATGALANVPSAGAQQPPGTHGSCNIPDSIPAPAVSFYSNVTYLNHVIDGVSIPLQLDVTVPTGVTNPPVIMMVHGGGMYTGDKTDQEPPSESHPGGHGDTSYWANLGFATVAVNYRLDSASLGPKYLTPIASGEFPAAIQDLRCALRWMRHNSKQYGFNADKIAVFGPSGGGGIVAALGTIPNSIPKKGDVGFFDSADCIDPVTNQLLTESTKIRLVIDTFGNNLYTDDLADDPLIPSNVKFDPSWLYQVTQSSYTVSDLIGYVWGSLYNGYANVTSIFPFKLSNPYANPPAPYNLSPIVDGGIGAQDGTVTQATASLIANSANYYTPGITAQSAMGEGEFVINYTANGADYVKELPAFFIMNGAQDSCVPTMQSVAFAELLKSHGVHVFGTVGLVTDIPVPNTKTSPLQPVYGLGHGFRMWQFSAAYAKSKAGQGVDVTNANGGACEMIKRAQCDLMGSSPQGACDTLVNQ